VEADISIEVKSRWQINFFNAYLEEFNLLKTGDIIWLNHSEKNCILAATNAEDDEIEYVSSNTSDSFQ